MSIHVVPRPTANVRAIVAKLPFSSNFALKKERPSGILEELLPELIQRRESKCPKG